MSTISLPVLPLCTSFREEHQWVEDAIRREARPGKTLHILEGGCGQRWFANLSDVPYHLTGVDLDDVALELRVRGRGDLHEAIVGDLLSIDLPEGAYDVIYNAFVLEHVFDPERLLKNFIRWLRPGGLLILRLPDRDSAKGFVTRCTPHWFHVAYYRHYKKNPNAGKPGHMPYPTPFGEVVGRAGIHGFCRQHGLNVVAENGRASRVDDAGVLYQASLKLIHTLSGGRLHAHYTDLNILIRKPPA